MKETTTKHCVCVCMCVHVSVNECVCVRERESVCLCVRMCGLCKTQFIYRKKRCTEVFVRTLYVNYLSFSNDIQWVISIFGVSILHTSLLNCFNWQLRNGWHILKLAFHILSNSVITITIITSSWLYRTKNVGVFGPGYFTAQTFTDITMTRI